MGLGLIWSNHKIIILSHWVRMANATTHDAAPTDDIGILVRVLPYFQFRRTRGIIPKPARTQVIPNRSQAMDGYGCICHLPAKLCGSAAANQQC
jgi:hypothetical protein